MSATCERCKKTAYVVEQVKCGPWVYHNKCFNCTQCNVPLQRGSQKQGPDERPHCSKCYAALFGPKGFRGGAVDGSVSVSEHKFDTQSHVKSPRNDVPASAPAGAAKRFCVSCGSSLTSGAHFCAGCGTKV